MLWPASFEASQTLVNERLSKASRGAGGMEQALWRFGDRRFAHVDGMAIGGGGLADTDLLDATSPGLGIGRFLSEVESHPTGVNRFVVHLSTVGATTKDLTIYREMLNAFRSWFENSALGNKKREDQTDDEWIDMIRKKLWMIYPDFSPHDYMKGVGKRIDFLAVQDFRQLESELSLEAHARFEGLRDLVEHEYRGNDAAPSD